MGNLSVYNMRIFLKDYLHVRFLKNKHHSWLFNNIAKGYIRIPDFPDTSKIEAIAKQTHGLGKVELWEGYRKAISDGYRDKGLIREPNQVRIQKNIGKFFVWLLVKKKPNIIVEIGTAFGISGMYWLSGIESLNHGKLITFEPNIAWAGVAIKNLALIGKRFNVVVGKFEDLFNEYFPKEQEINIAFIDAIHTSEAVDVQLGLILKRIPKGGLVVFDDICFSPDLSAYWRKIANDERFAASIEIDNKIGIIEI